MLKPVLFQAEYSVCRLMNQVKERFFPGRSIDRFRIRDQDMDVCCRQLPQRPHDPPQAFPAFRRFHLFIVIGVEQSENNHERAGRVVEKTGEFFGDRRLRLKRRERPCHVRPPQHCCWVKRE